MKRPYSGAETTAKRHQFRAMAQKPRGKIYPKKPAMRPGGYPQIKESKFVDFAVNAVADTTGAVSLIPTIAQGTTVSTRLGRKAVLTSVWIRAVFLANTTSVTNKARFLLVWDRQPNKALAAVTDVLDSANSNSMQKDENRERFKILLDEKCVLIGNTVTPTSQTAVVYDHYMKLPNYCVQEYTLADTTGVIGDLVTGALLLVTVGNVAAGTAAASVSGNIRTRFADP